MFIHGHAVHHFSRLRIPHRVLHVLEAVARNSKGYLRCFVSGPSQRRGRPFQKILKKVDMHQWQGCLLGWWFLMAPHQRVSACTTLVVGRAASADGSIFASHSNDGDGSAPPHLPSFPHLPTSPSPSSLSDLLRRMRRCLAGVLPQCLSSQRGARAGYIQVSQLTSRRFHGQAGPRGPCVR